MPLISSRWNFFLPSSGLFRENPSLVSARHESIDYCGPQRQKPNYHYHTQNKLTQPTVLTKCSLAAILAAQPINPKTNQPYRPRHLPPPTELPLRHCSHNPESSPIDEVDCLLSLLSPNAEVKKNKEHYILATADAPVKKVDKNDAQRKRKRDEEREEERALRRSQMLRLRARQIPGVPIIYVKRSVMVLEPLSTRSETVRDGAEKAKFRYGLDDPSLEKAEEEETKKKRGPKVKAPNPLSVKKSKKKETGPAKEKSQKKVAEDDDVPEKEDGDDAGAAKPKRRRRHHKSGAAFSNDNDDAAPLAETGPESGAMEVDE
jgi:U3 small nucleolar RNA-associated protein 23